MPRVIHFEIHADEPERAMKFYRSVFGWEFTAWKNMPVDYWVIRTGESDQPGIDGGLMRRRSPVDGVAVTAFACTIAVSDIDKYLMKVTTSGGQLAVDKMELTGIGWLVYCKDTEGNLFGMLQTKSEA